MRPSPEGLEGGLPHSLQVILMADSTVDLLRELKAGERSDDLSRMLCGVLRAMTVLGGSAWESDLHDALRMIWSLRQEEDKLGTAMLPRALEFLEEKGILTVEKRAKSDLSTEKAAEEGFYRIGDWLTILRIFGGDKEVVLSRGRY
jgi:hypothetical protein